MDNLLAASAVLVVGIALPASADVCTSLVGDRDGFGIAGMDPVPPDGTQIFGEDLTQSPTDPEFMDAWGNEQHGGAFGSPIEWNHSLDVPDPVVSASLVIQHAGMGDGNAWDVEVNGTPVGQIGPDSPYILSSAVETFAVPTSALDMTNTVELTYLGSSPEGFAINFSELTAVPEPATMALLGAGLAALALRRRRGR